MQPNRTERKPIIENLPPEILSALDLRIRDRGQREIESIWRWLEPQLPEGIESCPETLRRYIRRKEKAATDYVASVANLPPQPDPATMPATLLREEIGALASLRRRIDERNEAINRELDARHAAEAVKGHPRSQGEAGQAALAGCDGPEKQKPR